MRFKKFVSAFLAFVVAIGMLSFSAEKANADPIDEDSVFWSYLSPRYYYYYLHDQEGRIYSQFEDACQKCLLGEDKVYTDYSTGGITVQLDTTMPSAIRSKESLSKIYEIFCLDNPQYFFLTGEFSLDNEEDAGMITLHMYDDLCEAGSRKSAVKNVRFVLDSLIDTVPAELSDSEKEKSIHDWMCQIVSFGSSFFDDNLHSTAFDFASSRGYSNMFAALMNHFGIKTICISGEDHGESRYWNAVELNGFWYYVDVGSDDNDESNTIDLRYLNTNDLNGRSLAKSIVQYIPPVMCDNVSDETYESQVFTVEDADYFVVNRKNSLLQDSYVLCTSSDMTDVKKVTYNSSEYKVLNCRGFYSPDIKDYWDSFSTSFYYEKMEDWEREIYDLLDEKCMDLLIGDTSYETDEAVEIPISNILAKYPEAGKDHRLDKDFPRLFVADNPQYFFSDGTCRLNYRTTGTYMELTVANTFKPLAVRRLAAEFCRGRLDHYTSLVPADKRPEEKEHILHDEICKNIVYNNWFENEKESIELNLDQSIFGALMDHCVCNGYAMLTDALMNKVGINCIYVGSHEHAWNLLELHGYWFRLDCTWDDGGDEVLYDCYNTTGNSEDIITPIRYLPENPYDNMDEGETHTEYHSPYFTEGGHEYFIVNEDTEKTGFKRLALCLDSDPVDVKNVTHDGKQYEVINGKLKPTATPTAKPTAKPTATAKPTPTASAKPTAAPADSDSAIKKFVDRIYKYVLNREPEKEGAAFWTDELWSFRRSGAEVGLQFIFSPEFEARNTGDIEFVKILYKTFFDREADDAGLEYWVSELKSGARDRLSVAEGFVYSQEWADTCASYGIRSGGSFAPSVEIKPSAATLAFVERMYTTALGRKSDKEGCAFWSLELANFRFTGEQVGVLFFLSDEMNGFGLSDSEFVTRLYKTFMDREPEKEGFEFWVKFLGDGASRLDVVYGFTRSEEFVNRCIEARILPY